MIYFAQLSTGAIKIGYSEDVDSRMAQLGYHYSDVPSVLHTMPGGREVERSLHERFAHLRFGRTEQFRPAAELLAFIGKPLMVSPNPEAVEATASRSQAKEQELPFDAVSVKIDRRIAEMGKLLAAHKNCTLAELASDLLKGPIERGYAVMLRELEKGAAK